MTITLLFDVPITNIPHTPDWLPETIKLIYRWTSKSEHFKLVNIKDYEPATCPNVYYLKIIGDPKNSLNPAVWDSIPKESVDIINSNNISILIMFPFEYFSIINEQNLTEYITSFKTKFKYSKLVHVSITQFLDSDANTILIEDILKNPEFRDVFFVPTVGFLDPFYYINSQNQILTHSLTTNTYSTTRPFLYLCLNNNPNLARKFITQSLFVSNLLEHGIVSFRQATKWKFDDIQKINGTILSDEQYTFCSELVNSILQQNLCPVQSIDLTASNIVGHDLQASLTSKWFNDSWCSIVTETYDDPLTKIQYESPMITEKTTKPIMMLHPFVVFGNGYSHKWLQSLGFKTFEQSWFNLPEDGAVGNRTLFERTFNLIKSLRWLSRLSQEELYAKWKSVEDDLIFNKEHMLTTDWSEVQANLIGSLQKMTV